VSPALPHLTTAQIDNAWRQIHAEVDARVSRGQIVTPWEIAQGSALDGDDKRLHPWMVSHGAAAALSAALDHLHALTTSVMSPEPVLHNSAPYTLARASIENSAIAFWIVHPKGRAERLTRTLRWYASDIRDGDRAREGIGQPSKASTGERIQALRDRAAAHDCDPVEATEDLRYTGILKYADAQFPPDTTISPLFMWRLCSGFAHGRNWASLGLLAREVTPTGQPGVSHMRQTNSLDRVLSAALTAYELFSLASTTFEQRGANHRPG
jgi:hypothetical protein